MKRVCLVRRKYWPNKNQARNAAALASEGYHVDVICLGQKGEKPRETLDGVNVHRLFLPHHRGSIPLYVFDYSAFFVLSSLKLARLSLGKRYDVVEVDSMPDCFVFITLFPRLLGSKIILYMFENMPALFVSTFKKSPSHIGARVLRFLEKISAVYAHRVITSEGIPYKHVLESRGIPSSKITVVLNVPDDTIFDPESLPAREDGDHFRLVVVSTVLKRYGVQTLIRAIPILIRDIPELKVEVVGEGEFRPELEGLARDLGVEEYLNFTGHVALAEVPVRVSQADVGIAPMLDDVGVPNKVFDYFALGKPTVASALPSLVATFDGTCLSYFHPDDENELAAQVLELYRSPEKRDKLGRQGRELYESCRWKVMKQEYLKVYEELVA